MVTRFANQELLEKVKYNFNIYNKRMCRDTHHNLIRYIACKKNGQYNTFLFLFSTHIVLYYK